MVYQRRRVARVQAHRSVVADRAQAKFSLPCAGIPDVLVWRRLGFPVAFRGWIPRSQGGPERLSLLLDQPGCEHGPVTVVVQLNGKDEHVPIPVRALGGEMRRAAKTT